MNLKDLIDEVNSALDYNPDLEAYKSQVSRVINRHYLQISSQYPWLFRQKRVPLTLRADLKSKQVTESDDSVTDFNVLQVGEGDHYDASNVLYFKGVEQSLPTREMLGNTLVFNDNSTVTTMTSAAHGASEREFTVTGIFDTTTADSAAGGHTGIIRYAGDSDKEWPDGYQPNSLGGIVIDRPIIDPSTVATSGEDSNTRTIGTITKKYYTDWTLEFRKYYLPSDCVEVLGMVDRGLKMPVHKETATQDNAGNYTSTIATSTNTAPNRGRLIFIDSAKEEHLYLDRSSSGDPVVGIEGMVTSIDPPMEGPTLVSSPVPEDARTEFIITYEDGETLVPFEDIGRSDFISHLFSPMELEYCYTFVEKGIESAPSPVSRLPAYTPTGSAPIEQRMVFVGTESTEGTFRRNYTFGPEPLTFDAISGGRARTPGDTDAETKTRYTGKIKRFYRRVVPSNIPAVVRGEKGGESGGTIDMDEFLAGFRRLIGHNSTGNGRWMHIGDCIGDGLCIDIGRRQDRFSTETSTAVLKFGHQYSGPTFLGWPDSYQINQGQWSYYDGELHKIRNLDECGPRQSIRIYRPPSQDMDVEIRYLSRPRRLVANGDAPEWPTQYHHLLVYMTLKDVCLQHGMTTQSQLYEKKADELLYQMKQKYLTRTNRKYVRQGFDRAVFAGERFGVPTKV